ncbi:MAG: hypothetical protein IJT90_00560 [Bacteroidaceae bacterium]|nr:hypothetical protein [Bacteroidaceae bacterium]
MNRKKHSASNCCLQSVMLVLLLCMSPRVVYPKDGDVNSDNEVNTADVVGIYSYIISGAESGITVGQADLNSDGKVNSADVVALYRHIIIGAPFAPYYVDKMEVLTDGSEGLHLAKNSVKSRKAINFKADIDSWGESSELIIGHGSAGDYYSSWVEITGTSVHAHSYLNSESIYSYEHGLNITDGVEVCISKEMNGTRAVLSIESNGYKFEESIYWLGDNGTTGGIYANVRKAILKNCTMYWSSRTLRSDVWLFGDSYFSLDSYSRWTKYLIEDGHDDWLYNAFPGAKSVSIIQDFKNLLDIARPKYAVWCMGMNDKDNKGSDRKAANPNTNWQKATEEFLSLCQEKGIIPILSTIPTVIGGMQASDFRYHGAKNAWVRNSGFRYVDFATAVGADDDTGYWYGQGTDEDYLEGNANSKVRVHPTIAGAKALYGQFIKDCADIIE